MDSAIITLRERAPSNELDYGFVMDCLKGYSSPRAKLSRLLKSGALIRIKIEIDTDPPPGLHQDISYILSIDY